MQEDKTVRVQSVGWWIEISERLHLHSVGHEACWSTAAVGLMLLVTRCRLTSGSFSAALCLFSRWMLRLCWTWRHEEKSDFEFQSKWNKLNSCFDQMHIESWAGSANTCSNAPQRASKSWFQWHCLASHILNLHSKSHSKAALSFKKINSCTGKHLTPNPKPSHRASTLLHVRHSAT